MKDMKAKDHRKLDRSRSYIYNKCQKSEGTGPITFLQRAQMPEIGRNQLYCVPTNGMQKSSFAIGWLKKILGFLILFCSSRITKFTVNNKDLNHVKVPNVFVKQSNIISYILNNYLTK
jgi:hypothetical protein